MKTLTNRQKQIIEISINIISENGIQELTMKNLSCELGISEPAIYRHFESKQKILIAVLDSFKHQNKLINENLNHEGETSFQHLKRTIDMIIIKFKKNPAMSAVIFSEEIFQNKGELSGIVKNIMNSTIDFFSILLEKGQADGSIRTDIGRDDLSVIVMGSIRHIVTIWRLSGFSIDLEKAGEKLVKTLEVLIAA
jgi:TetR/AcrR family transcriptional regulator, fatty acid metabolism regulator protein